MEEHKAENIFLVVSLISLSLGLGYYYLTRPERTCEKKGHVYSSLNCQPYRTFPRLIVKDYKDSTVVVYHSQEDSMYNCPRCGITIDRPFNVKDSIVDIIKKK